MIAVDRSVSSSQLRVSEMVSRVTRLLFESQCYSERNERLVFQGQGWEAPPRGHKEAGLPLSE